MTGNVAIALGTLAAMLVLVYAGMHVAVALGLLSLVGVWLIKSDPQIAANLLAQAASDAIQSHIFGVVPLFVLMGLLVAHAEVGRDAFEVAQRLLARVRGGLGVATVAANAVFAAITGISIASAAVFSRVSVPEMLRLGYAPRFAVGVVAGSSVLGMLIPPSLLFILYGFLANQSVGALFTAGIVPGLMLACTYTVAIVVGARLFPRWLGAVGIERRSARLGLPEAIAKLAPSAFLIGICLGGIYAGAFTATEAGAVGAALALALALVRGRLDRPRFWQVLTETGHVTVSISFLIICANVYTRMLAMSGTPQFLIGAMAEAGLGAHGFLAIYIGVILLLGTIIDSSSILLICLPLVLPIAETLQLDLIWFGVITVVAVEIGLLTPPFGLSVFVIHSTLNDPRIRLGDIWRGAFPFACIMLGVLVLLVAFPQISLVLLKS